MIDTVRARRGTWVQGQASADVVVDRAEGVLYPGLQWSPDRTVFSIHFPASQQAPLMCLCVGDSLSLTPPICDLRRACMHYHQMGALASCRLLAAVWHQCGPPGP